MWEFLCECLKKLDSPSIDELLHSIKLNTVCTTEQCFETLEDAGFGTLQSQPTNYAFMMFMIMLFFMWYSLKPAPLLDMTKTQGRY